MAANVAVTEKLKSYFFKNRLNRNQKFTNRQQRQIIETVGCTSFDLVEFVTFGMCYKKEGESQNGKQK